METGRASRTAFRVAHRRAVHQVLDQPSILHDPIAIPLLGTEFAIDRDRESHPLARAFRAFMAARSRFAEDELAGAIKRGVRRYVVLGAGLDTFAYRNNYVDLRVFEVDFPATQQWKRALLANAGIEAPPNLMFVPLDFEHQTLGEGLRQAGLKMTEPAFFGWLGVVPYLSLEAFRSTIATIAQLPHPTAVTFDFAISPKLLGPRARAAFELLAARVAAAGEPFQLFFEPQELEGELRRAGFSEVELTGADDLNARYFTGRADGLALPSPGLGMMATARI
ncbi:MAG TPA: SAM-dependent methyltransferase [Terracidiphilus sp.]|nr:SAM-dependent methyltransferase [Terracidiphilus sp.]